MLRVAEIDFEPGEEGLRGARLLTLFPTCAPAPNSRDEAAATRRRLSRQRLRLHPQRLPQPLRRHHFHLQRRYRAAYEACVAERFEAKEAGVHDWAPRRALVTILDDGLQSEETALLSERALANWNRPEEDAPWSHLQPAG